MSARMRSGTTFNIVQTTGATVKRPSPKNCQLSTVNFKNSAFRFQRKVVFFSYGDSELNILIPIHQGYNANENNIIQGAVIFMATMNALGLKDRDAWERAGVVLPKFDWETMV